ncbi:hypothetical protein K1719_012964 [Acacia pycnantha]|nr:hypothetical protein K1719_012964 [Acacia pycnantha]
MAVVRPQYCCPYPVDLAIVGKVMTVADKFTVTDINGNVVFKLQASLLTLHDHRVLLDAAQNPVVTLRRKIMTMHDRSSEAGWNDLVLFMLANPTPFLPAQMHKKHTVQSIAFGKTDFMVMVYPNVDYPFILALIVILDEINQDSKSDSSSIPDDFLSMS